MNHMDTRRKRGFKRFGTRTAPAIGVALALALAACGSDDEAAVTTVAPATTAAPGTTADTPGATTAPAATAPAATETPATAAAPVNMAQDGCDEVVIGVVLSSSGIYSQLGADTQLAVDGFSKIHPDILGTPLKFQVENDGSDPTAGVAATQRLLGDPCVVALSGPGSGATQTAALPVIVAAKKPAIFNTPVLYENFNKEPYTFRQT